MSVQFTDTFYSAFKYCCRARGEKLEKTKISYACLARVVRDGGFKIALIARLSAIPGHCQFVMKCSARSSIFLLCPSHYCHFLDVWHEHFRIHTCRLILHA